MQKRTKLKKRIEKKNFKCQDNIIQLEIKQNFTKLNTYEVTFSMTRTWKFEYSSVPNRRACTFINFEKKFPPAQPYLGLHVYCF